MELYHGANEIIEEVKGQGIFGGLFAAADKEAALAHGDTLHVIKIDDDKVMTQQDLDYHVDYDKVVEIIKSETFADSEEEVALAYSIIVEDESVHDADEDQVLSILSGTDLAEASWEGQRIRGVIARAFGFDAVEMNDEHGTTYLVLPGVKVEVAA